MRAKTSTADVTRNNRKTLTANKTKKDEKTQCGAYKRIVKAQQRPLSEMTLLETILSVAAQRRKRMCCHEREGQLAKLTKLAKVRHDREAFLHQIFAQNIAIWGNS